MSNDLNQKAKICELDLIATKRFELRSKNPKKTTFHLDYRDLLLAM